MKFEKLAAIATAAAIACPATAHADTANFQSPSGNIVCLMGTIVNGPNNVVCEITDHTWVAPPQPNCHMNSGDRFSLNQGGPADFGCYHQPMGPASETLGYGQTRSVGAITCDSEPGGVTCTDSSTGHFFRVSRDSYQLG